jgi:hypothetical protein
VLFFGGAQPAFEIGDAILCGAQLRAEEFRGAFSLVLAAARVLLDKDLRSAVPSL